MGGGRGRGAFGFIPVLLGGDANAYGMARSFYEEYGVQSRVLCKGAFHICRHSKLLSVDVVEPRLDEDETFLGTLLSYSRRIRTENPGYTPLLVSCGDNYTRLLVRHQEALRGAYVFRIVNSDRYELFATKGAFYRTCKRFGLPIPATCEVTRDQATAGFEPPFPFPVAVKPSNDVAYRCCEFPGKKKAYVARDQAELQSILKTVYSSSYRDPMIVQDFVPGDDGAMRVVNCYSDGRGRVTMAVVGDVLLEEHTPEGIGSYGAIMTGFDEGILGRIRSFLDAIGYVGFSNFDLKYDCRDGTCKLLELNPRQGRSSYFATASGMNLARYLVRDAVFGERVGFETARPENRVLWTMVPLSIIDGYVADPDLRSRARSMVAQGRLSWSYWSRDDRSVARWLSFQMNQRNYRRQYEACFGRRHAND